MERPFQERDIAERPGEAVRGRIAFQPAAVLGQHHEGEVGPDRLRGDPVQKVARVSPAEGLLGNDGKLRTLADFAQQFRYVGADMRPELRLAQDATRHHSIPAARREDQRPLRSGWRHHVASISGCDWPT
jgi:hypothetical protein